MKYLNRIDEMFDDKVLRDHSREYKKHDWEPYKGLDILLPQKVNYLNNFNLRKIGRIKEWKVWGYGYDPKDRDFFAGYILVIPTADGNYHLTIDFKALLDDRVVYDENKIWYDLTKEELIEKLIGSEEMYKDF